LTFERSTSPTYPNYTLECWHFIRRCCKEMHYPTAKHYDNCIRMQ